jgi:hypothetical protein
MKTALSLLARLAGWLVLLIPAQTSAAELGCVYQASQRLLTVTTAQGRRFRYGFNPGGAIASIRDLDLAPETELIGDSFQGETTDRVIQWTYWNCRYLTPAHGHGDGDRRANVTMEGSYGGAEVCEVLETPADGSACEFVFRSRITHWFYADLDRHGRPDFETTSRYRVLEDGSLWLERRILRRRWPLKDVTVRVWQPITETWLDTPAATATLEARHLWPESMTSYLEAWTPLRRSVLPQRRHGGGSLATSGYRFLLPKDLGGWVMAYGERQALAVVFGAEQPSCPPWRMRAVFNSLDEPGHNLTILLPGIETDWPEDRVIEQHLAFVVGSPLEVPGRAEKLAPQVPPPKLLSPP